MLGLSGLSHRPPPLPLIRAPQEAGAGVPSPAVRTQQDAQRPSTPRSEHGGHGAAQVPRRDFQGGPPTACAEPPGVGPKMPIPGPLERPTPV